VESVQEQNLMEKIAEGIDTVRELAFFLLAVEAVVGF
jgi:hypothetical protein